MNKLSPKQVHELFLLGLALKGFNGAAELTFGLFAWFSSPHLIQRFAAWFVEEELYEDPADLMMNWVLRLSNGISVNNLEYLGLFLILHGVVKLVVIGFLFRGKLKAYPVAVLIFGLFGVYQLVHFFQYRSTVDVFLIFFDTLVIGLTLLEYRRIRSSLKKK